MKRSNWVRLIAVILIISMLAAPVSAAPNRGNDGVRTNGVFGIIVDFIRDIIRDIFDDWFDKPGEEEPTPTTPVNPTTPTQPGETEPEETDPTEPIETTAPTEPTEPEEKVETVLNLVEGYSNTENGHLLRGDTYTLSQVVTQQAQEPQVAPYALRSASMTNFATSYSVQAAAEPTYERLNITFDENGNAIIPDGDYKVRFVSDQYACYMLKDLVNSSPWQKNALGGTTNQDAATLFTFTRQTDGTYTIQGPGKWYLVLHDENAGKMQADANYIDRKSVV